MIQDDPNLQPPTTEELNIEIPIEIPTDEAQLIDQPPKKKNSKKILLERKLSIIDDGEEDNMRKNYMETLRRRSRVLSVIDNEHGTPIKIWYKVGSQLVFKVLYFYDTDTVGYVQGLLLEKFSHQEERKKYLIYASYDTPRGIVGTSSSSF
jgi:hypothetical protein